jgi:hypothetical protein
MRVTASAMQQQDRIVGMPRRISMWLPKRKVMQLQFRNRFSAAEVIVRNNIITVLRWPLRVSLGIN